MKESRIVAVDHVCLEAPRGLVDRLTWFYNGLLDLDLIEDGFGAVDDVWLRFKSGRIELRIRIHNEPEIESVDCCVTILVPSLFAVREVLDEQLIRYHPFTGVVYSDRRIGLLDPAGNRLELKQQWPFGLV